MPGSLRSSRIKLGCSCRASVSARLPLDVKHHREAALLQRCLQQVTRVAIVVHHQHLARTLQHTVHGRQQPQRIDRLGQIIHRAQPQPFLLIAHHRHNHHRDIFRGRIILQLLQQLKAVGIRQIDVERNQTGLAGARLLQRFLARPAMLT